MQSCFWGCKLRLPCSSFENYLPFSSPFLFFEVKLHFLRNLPRPLPSVYQSSQTLRCHFSPFSSPTPPSAAATTTLTQLPMLLSGIVILLVALPIANASPAKRKQQQGAGGVLGLETAAFLRWGMGDVMGALNFHPVPCVFAVSLLLFMCVECTLQMVPANSPPLDLGFVATRWLNRLLAARPALNTILAGLNTVFVAMQLTYILWTFLVEGRLRPGLAALFMFTCRGILGYSTQLPLPQDFLGSGADFPVGNVSFFLFFSGHVAGSVIASLDMRRTQRKELAWTFDVLNFLQVVRLLGTRGHYTIDLAVGGGAGILFDFLAGIYIESKRSLSEGGKMNIREENKISC